MLDYSFYQKILYVTVDKTTGMHLIYMFFNWQDMGVHLYLCRWCCSHWAHRHHSNILNVQRFLMGTKTHTSVFSFKNTIKTGQLSQYLQELFRRF